MRLTSFSLLAATLAAPALAQTSVVVPPQYDRAWGTSSSSGLGGNSTRTQMVLANPLPLGTPVLGVGFRCAASTADRAAFTADIQVEMSSSTAVPGALSSTFASNIGPDLTVALPQQIVNIPAMPANRGTGEWATFMFNAPFFFGLNGNTSLVVDLFVHSRSAGASWSSDRVFAGTAGSATNVGIGCGSATINSSSTNVGGSSYVGGETVTITLAGAPANTLGLLIYSFDMKEAAPFLPLPINLAILGTAPDCDLLVNTSEGVNAFLADGAGAASGSFTIPAHLGNFGLGWQWGYGITPTPQNPLGLEVTRVRHTYIGPRIATPDQQYVYSLFDVNAATGTNTVNSCVIVQLITP